MLMVEQAFQQALVMGYDFDGTFNYFYRTPIFKNKVGEQCDCGGIDDLKLIHPFRMLMPPAVRYKFMPVTGVQVAIYGFKYGLRTTSVGIGERAATDFKRYPYMRQLMGVCQ